MRKTYVTTEHGDLVDNSTVSRYSNYGLETFIYQYATVEDDCTIGERVVIGSNVFVGARSNIGNGTRIQHGAFLCRGARIGKNVFIGPLAILTDDKYPRVGNKDYKAEPPILEDGCSIGAGAIILPGVRVGAGAIVGAGAVVTKDVAGGDIVTRVPAVPKRRIAGNDDVYTQAELVKFNTGNYEAIDGVFFKRVEREGFGIE